MNRFKGTKGEATEGYEICNKQDIQKALVEKNSGKCRAYSTTYYGDVMIVSTVIAGNLIYSRCNAFNNSVCVSA